MGGDIPDGTGQNLLLSVIVLRTSIKIQESVLHRRIEREPPQSFKVLTQNLRFNGEFENGV